MSDSADRTLAATPRRRELARRQGMMPMAALPAWVATVATTLLLLPTWGAATFPAATTLVRESILASSVGPATPPRFDLMLPVSLLLPTLALVAVAGAVGLTVRVCLDGGAWQLSRVAPTLARISLWSGLGRIFALATLAAIVGHACGLALLATTAAVALAPLIRIISSGELSHDPVGMLAAAHRAMLWLVTAAAAVAACTWAVSRLRFERRIRMTPQEHADEARSLEADPKVRLMREQRRRAA